MMKVRLTRDARIWHKAGETVEVSPAEAGFLLSTGSAEIIAHATVQEQKETTAKEPKSKKTKK